MQIISITSTTCAFSTNMFRYTIFSVYIFIFLLIVETYLIQVNCYVLPTPTFEILEPSGIRVSIPDAPGVRFFAFQGNVNNKITLNELGVISGESYKKEGKTWNIQNQNVNLVNGDVIHYYTYVQVNERIYNSGEETFTVGTTTKLLFHDNFDYFDDSKWRHEVKIPITPDYEFCVFQNDQHTFLVYAENGILKIQPDILEDKYGENVTSFGRLQLSDCSSEISAECMRTATSFNILPPIMSARLVTKHNFNFLYGKIEIRAKFPEGDWLYPEMMLKPKYNYYGPDYSSGCIILGLARGNENLIKTTDGSIYDARRLECGFRIGETNNVTSYMVSTTNENGPRWTKGFHIYTTIWNSNGFQFLVDGKEIGKLNPPKDSWLHRNGYNTMAPFDQEFYIILGVGVGGIRVFPDGMTSSKHEKPWRNVGAKAMLRFWRARDQWLPSWRKENKKKLAFEIDYIKVWSF